MQRREALRERWFHVSRSSSHVAFVMSFATVATLPADNHALSVFFSSATLISHLVGLYAVRRLARTGETP